jgi:hypothetical protein
LLLKTFLGAGIPKDLVRRNSEPVCYFVVCSFGEFDQLLVGQFTIAQHVAVLRADLEQAKPNGHRGKMLGDLTNDDIEKLAEFLSRKGN